MMYQVFGNRCVICMQVVVWVVKFVNCRWMFYLIYNGSSFIVLLVYSFSHRSSEAIKPKNIYYLLLLFFFVVQR